MPGELLLLTMLVVGTTAASTASAREDPNAHKQKSALASKRASDTAFLQQYCTRCHGTKKQEGKLALHQLDAKPVTETQVGTWKKMFGKLVSGEMPPEEAKQPSPNERAQALQWIKAVLRSAGVAVDDGKWMHPSRGNWVNHDALFSGKETAETATRGRLWRLTGQGYEEFIQSLNVKYRLGFRTYGHHRVRSPWELSPHEGFRDYASGHRIGEPEIEHHLRNATRVARAMVARLPKSRIDDVQALKELLKAGDKSTSELMPAAALAAFNGILGRHPSKEELERYASFLQGNMKSLGPEKAIEQLLVAILFHPEVMYRIELPVDGAKRALMPPRDLARAIAYALTDAEPDEVLVEAGVDGNLVQLEEIRAQVVRILNDREIAKPRILRFFQEYFGYTKAIDIFKDSATRKAAGFRGKNDWHPNFFVSDADRLVAWILESDKNVLYELLTTSKTFAVTGNTKQALGVKKNATKPFSLFAQTTLDIYELDIKREDWSDERPFEMPREHRMGILTHPSWLIAHSTNFDNHAIHRGRWIRERLLGGKIPEIPVTVDAQLPDEPERTLRERMRVTREEYCWKCHQHMDPLGLPFENFDHFGRFRTTELEKPVNATGNVRRSGDQRLDGPVKDPLELLRKLAESKRVEQVFVRHAFRYFMGRNEMLADGPILVAAHQAYVKSEGSMNALITVLLTSDAFLLRTVNDDDL